METHPEQKHVKVLFRYFSNVLDEDVVETMWAIAIDEAEGLYKLDSIPFYGPLIAPDDEFLAEFDEGEGQLVYTETVNPSGNSIVIVVIMQEGFDKEILRNGFNEMGCPSEGVNDSYFSMEIPYDIDYSIISKRLMELEEQEVIAYAEPCLSEKHSEDLE